MSHPYQVHILFILKELQTFFSHHQKNLIEFWECPSHCNWALHKAVDKETKSFNPISLFLCKVSWNLSKRNECDNIANKWKMTFQASDLRESISMNCLTSKIGLG